MYTLCTCRPPPFLNIRRIRANFLVLPNTSLFIVERSTKKIVLPEIICGKGLPREKWEVVPLEGEKRLKKTELSKKLETEGESAFFGTECYPLLRRLPRGT